MKRPSRERGFRVPSIRRARTRAVSALAAGLVVVLSAPAARADGSSAENHPIPSPRSADVGPTTVRRWYGYQTMISDVFSTSVFFAGAASMNICISPFGGPTPDCHNEVANMLLVSGTAGYALGGPIIHAAHGRWDKAGYSLGLRVVPVAAAIGMGEVLGAGDGAPFLVTGTAVTAMVLDSALLGYETVAVEAPKMSLAPSYDPKRGSGSLVFTGTF
jgi:hypothetical protein